ncbi:hypothetical protein HMPREF9144_0919 [Prevotella pallens ATCC 700821]|uniref:Uncharacterized protein n=1 Tax=Prevotella pallens ATCC 700821 TaxID=997353 RepID=F9DGX9_9BACT|nr:hypothetical protein HMPREF9144_0919 [Prevotella pallens ATCC 700821]
MLFVSRSHRAFLMCREPIHRAHIHEYPTPSNLQQIILQT